MSKLTDKVIAITGASSGIGAALAERVARGGARPVLVARRREMLDAVAARCSGQATVVVADLTVRAEVRRALTDAFRTELKESDPGIIVSLVSPGVVYTDFGKNAMHGGPDSRAIPGGQDVADVVEVIVGVIESRRTDVYTRAGAQAEVAAYYAGLGTDP